jgi:hypothetical protein
MENCAVPGALKILYVPALDVQMSEMFSFIPKKILVVIFFLPALNF